MAQHHGLGRVALVTGSTSGIGLGVAQVLASRGYHVVLSGSRSEAEAAPALEVVKAARLGPAQQVAYVQADLSLGTQAVEEAKKMIQVAVKLGGIHVLVNNGPCLPRAPLTPSAGVQHVSPVATFPLNEWDRLLNLNLTAAFLLIQAALPVMLQQMNPTPPTPATPPTPTPHCAIINISSVHGLVASVNKVAYVASKHGLNGLTKVVALEHAQHGSTFPPTPTLSLTPLVTCNALCPGWVKTPLVERQIEARAAEHKVSLSEAQAELLLEKEPSRHFTSPEDIGDMVALLASPSGRNMTGTLLPMDGGWTAQ